MEKTFEDYAQKWEATVKAITDAFAALTEILAKFVKTFCNVILLLALKTVSVGTKQALALSVYRPVLRHKTAIRGLTLKLAK